MIKKRKEKKERKNKQKETPKQSIGKRNPIKTENKLIKAQTGKNTCKQTE